MANFNFQGKIIRQFWGKLIRQSTLTPSKTSGLQLVTGGVFILLSLYSVLFSVKK